MLYKNQYFLFTHLMDVLSTYYVPGSVQSTEMCISKMRGEQERTWALAALKKWVLKGVGV